MGQGVEVPITKEEKHVQSLTFTELASRPGICMALEGSDGEQMPFLDLREPRRQLQE